MSARPIPTVEEVWRRYDEMEARLSAPLSERMIELARLGPGMRVLDLATGRGEPAIRAAQRVAPGGAVLGVDRKASMLEMARERARREGVSNLELRVMDATSLQGIPAAAFDAVLVRWALMYMDRPLAALEGARRALVPGGRLVVAVWAEPERVPYFTLPRKALEKFRSVPPIDFEAPGIFHYADPERLRRDLGQAGFRVEHEEELDTPVLEAATGAEVVEWERAFGWTAQLDDLREDTQRAWEEELAREAEAFRVDGKIRIGGVTRVVVATPM